MQHACWNLKYDIEIRYFKPPVNPVFPNKKMALIP